MDVKQALIDIKNTAMRPYYHFRMWFPIWKFLNAKPRRLYAASSPQLTEAQKRVVQELSTDGIAISHLDELFPGRSMLAVLQSEMRRLESRATPNEKKMFLTQLIELYPVLDVESPFVTFALSPEVLGCVSAYLGMWPKLFYYTLGVTEPVEPGLLPRQSQNWHRDPEDRFLCKVFVYLTDVDASSGPFTYVRRSTRGHEWGNVYPQRPPHGRYPPEGEVERRIPASDIRSCTGRAGTVIFADTSGLHKGGYATANRRVMSTTGFITSASTRGVSYTRPPDFERRIAAYPPIAQYALRNATVHNRD